VNHRYRLFIALAGFLITLTQGGFYAWGVFVPALQADFGWTRVQAVLPFSVASMVFAVMMFPAGRLQDRRGPRLVVMVGALLGGIGYVLSAHARTLWELTGAFGLLSGTGIALGYAGVVAGGIRWFPDRRGTATGIMVGGFGLGALAFAAPIHYLLAVHGWRLTFLMIGVFFSCAIGLLSLVLRLPPPGWRPRGWDPARAQRTRTAEYTGQEATVRTALGTPEFAGLWVNYLLITSAGFAIIAHIKPFATDFAGLAPASAVALISLFSLFNFGGRLILSPLSDRLGRLPTFVLIGLFMMAAVASLPLSLSLGAPWLLRFSAISGGLAFGGYLALSPALTADLWGISNFGAVYGAMFTAWGVAGLLGPFLAGRVYDLLGSYVPSFWLLALLCLFANGVILLWVRPVVRRRVAAGRR